MFSDSVLPANVAMLKTRRGQHGTSFAAIKETALPKSLQYQLVSTDDPWLLQNCNIFGLRRQGTALQRASRLAKAKS